MAKIAILADIHSNLEALMAVMDDKPFKEADEVVFLGDLVGYGANPSEVIDIVRKKDWYMMGGNHDHAVCIYKLTGLDGFISGWSSRALEAVQWTADNLSDEDVQFLMELNVDRQYGDLYFVHGFPWNDTDFDTEEERNWAKVNNYVNNRDDAMAALSSRPEKVIFYGHTHYPMWWGLGEQKRLNNGSEVNVKDGRHLINPGSVGQPRGYDVRACYGILDTETKIFTLHRAAYDNITACDKILSKDKLDPKLGNRLLCGF